MKTLVLLFALLTFVTLPSVQAQQQISMPDTTARIPQLDSATTHRDSLRPDTVVVPESARILIEKLTPSEIRSRLIPRVMSRGWTMVRNRNDTIAFERPAVPELVSSLFGIPSAPAGHRVRLSFAIQATNTRIGSFLEVWAQIFPRTGKALAHPTTGDALAVSLEELRRDLENPVNAEIQ